MAPHRRATIAAAVLGVMLVLGSGVLGVGTLTACAADSGAGGDPAPAAGGAARAARAVATTPAVPAEDEAVPAEDGADPAAMPEIAANPAGLAAQIVAAERTVRDPDTAPLELALAAHVQQRAYRMLAERPEWDEEVRANVPLDLHLALRANTAARRELRSMHTHLLETLPAWRIVEPRPAEELLGYYREAEAAYSVPWEYLAAIHLVETAIGRVDGVSVAGALGPMQFMPGTWGAFGDGDVHDPRDAILAAARYLAHSGAPSDMAAALFAYNRHHAYVRAITHYASVMMEDPAAYRGYHQWQVYVLTVAGDVVMPVGYHETERIPVEELLARQR